MITCLSEEAGIPPLFSRNSQVLQRLRLFLFAATTERGPPHFWRDVLCHVLFRHLGVGGTRFVGAAERLRSLHPATSAAELFSAKPKRGPPIAEQPQILNEKACSRFVVFVVLFFILLTL